MKVLRWTLQFHKWIALVVGIQVLLWALGGLVMTVIPIERVRGEHHVPEAVATALPTAELLSLTEAAARAGVAPTKAELRQTPRGPVWALSPVKGDAAVLDARTGARLAPYGADQARAFALRAYRGEGSPVQVALLSRAPQGDGQGRRPVESRFRRCGTHHPLLGPADGRGRVAALRALALLRLLLAAPHHGLDQGRKLQPSADHRRGAARLDHHIERLRAAVVPSRP